MRKHALPEYLEQLSDLFSEIKVPDYHSRTDDHSMTGEEIADARARLEAHRLHHQKGLDSIKHELEQVDSHDIGSVQRQLEEEQSGIGPVGGAILGGGLAAGGVIGGGVLAKKYKDKHGVPDWARGIRGARSSWMKPANDKGAAMSYFKKSANPIMELIHNFAGSDAGASMPSPQAPKIPGQAAGSELGAGSPFHADPEALKALIGKQENTADDWKQYLDEHFGEPSFLDQDYHRDLQTQLGKSRAEGRSDDLLSALQGSQGRGDEMEEMLQQMLAGQPELLEQAQAAGRSSGVEEGAGIGGVAGGGAGLLAGGLLGAGGAAALGARKKKGGAAMSLLDQIRDEAFNTQPRRKYASRNSGINLDAVFAKIADEEGDEGSIPMGASGDDQSGNNENGEIPGLGSGAHEEANEGVQLPPELQHLLMMLMQHPEILQKMMHGGGGIPDEAVGGPEMGGGGAAGGGMPPELAAMAGGGGGAPGMAPGA